MTPKIRFPHLALLGLLAAFAAPAQAQEGDVEVVDVVAAEATWTDENFEQWVYGNAGNQAAARERLISLLTLQIDDIHRVCSLTEAQKKKLQLAGRGDIKKLFDRVDEKKKKFQLVKNDQNKIGEIFQEIQPLQLEFQGGSFEDGSLLMKVVKKTLDPAQSEKFAGMTRERRMYRYRARVEMAVAMLDNLVAFRADQRQRLQEVILAETLPPRKFGNYDYYVVMNQLAKLPEAKVRPILDDVQWKAFSKQLEQAKGMSSFIQEGGFLDEEKADKPAEKKD